MDMSSPLLANAARLSPPSDSRTGTDVGDTSHALGEHAASNGDGAAAAPPLGTAGDHVVPDRWRRVPQFVDPHVSRVKFEREVALFRAREDEYRRRGWFLAAAEFPRVLVLFAAPHIRPAPLLFGADFDFSSYDLVPPSLRLVDPFTRAPYTLASFPVPPLLRRTGAAKPADDIPHGEHAPPDAPAGGEQSGAPSDGARGPIVAQPPALAPAPAVMEVPVVPLLQAWRSEDTPFVCVRGVREYHANPAHSGDPWLLYRGRGEGTLLGLCEMLDAFGVQPLAGYHVRFRVQSVRAPNALQQVIQYQVMGLEIDPNRIPA